MWEVSVILLSSPFTRKAISGYKKGDTRPEVQAVGNKHPAKQRLHLWKVGLIFMAREEDPPTGHAYYAAA